MSSTEHTFAGPSTPPIPVKGFDAAGIHCGIKPTGALDLALIASPAACRAAAVFTQNAFPAAPVLYDRDLLRMNPDGNAWRCHKQRECECLHERGGQR